MLFDSVRLVRLIDAPGFTTRFCDIIKGFADTRPLFKELYKDILPNIKQHTVITHVLKKDYDAHNGVADVVVLQSAVDKSPAEHKALLRFSFSLQDVMQGIQSSLNEDRFSPSLQCLVSRMGERKAIGSAMANKNAYSGLGIEQLK